VRACSVGGRQGCSTAGPWQTTGTRAHAHARLGSGGQGLSKSMRMQVVFVGGCVAAAFALLAGIGAAEVGSTASAPYLTNAVFIVSCGFSHRNTDDLIRYPGQPGKSHNHTYVGNRSTNALSTPTTLKAASTTCDRPADTAAYWMPTLYAGADAVVPDKAIAYYRRATAHRVVPFPQGFRMIAGNMMATSEQRLQVVSWNCRGGGGALGPPSASAPACQPDARLALQVNFPSCWDGHSLDAPNHASHVAYPVGGRCPTKRPVALPALALVYQFPAIAPGTIVTLASGGQYSGHADFVNSWNQAGLKQLVTLCLNEARGCGQLPPRE
jgi:hypothetical protein